MARPEPGVARRAEPGAAPEGMIPLCVPEIRGNEWRYVKECLDTGWVSSVGAYVDRFEAQVAQYVGARRAVATVNGTTALHIALLVAGVEPDDEVIVSTLSFIAPANAVRYVGAWPVFMDASSDCWQMDPAKVRDFVQRGCSFEGGVLRNRATGRRVRALLPVDVLGHPVDLDPLLGLARQYGLAVVEDATESLGARYKGERIGRRADVACLSFNGNKLLTTGGGGMIVTDDAAWADRAKYLTTQAKDDPIEYVHGEVGFNYRLTNVQAAIGCAQLEQIDEYIAAKRRIAARYAEALAGIPGIGTMPEAVWATSVFWMYTILVDEGRFGHGSRALLRHLEGRRVQARPLWQPLHRSPAHAGSFSWQCDTAERLHRNALSLPCSVGLTPEQQDTVVSAIAELARGA